MKKALAITLCCFIYVTAFSQVGIGTADPDPSAALDVSSSSKGLLIPQMTQAQRLVINKPATGLLILQTDAPAGFYYNAGTPTVPNWLNLSAYTLQQNINTNGKWISHDGNDNGLFVDPQGLGIGTSSPDTRLTIQQADGASKLMSFRTSTTMPAWEMGLVSDNLQFVEPGVPGRPRVWLQKGGKVGIGTNTPFGNLGIRGTQFGDLLSFHSDIATLWHLNLNSANDLDFVESGVSANRLLLKAGGNIGMGTANPYARLGIAANGTGDLLSFGTLDGPQVWNIKMNGNNLNFEETGVGDNRLYLEQGGNVGVGTNLLHSRFNIKGDANNDLLAFNNNQFDQTRWHFAMTNGTDLNLAETGQSDGRIYLKMGGNVGIGTTNPEAKLDVAGDIKYSGTLNVGHTYRFRDDAVGAGNFAVRSIGCPTGTLATGGGGGHRDWNSASQDIIVNYVGPDPDNPTTHWRIILENKGTASRDVRLYVLCAKIQ